MSAAAFSFSRVGLIAGNTLREAARQRVLGFLVLLALALVVGGQWLRELNFGSSELKFLADLGFGALALFGAVLAIVATAQLFFSEVELRTLHTLLAKPVRRSEFLLGKLAGVVALLAVYTALMTGVIAAILWLRQAELARQLPEALARGGPVNFAAIAAAGVAQWLKLSLLAALTLLIASFARTQLFAAATGFLVLVICHLQFFAQSAAARGESVFSGFFAGGVALLFPDFQVFDLSELVIGGDGIWPRLARLVVYSVGYLVAVAVLAVVSFRKREL